MQNDNKAVASMVLGIVALCCEILLGWTGVFFIIGLICAIVGVILGIISKNDIKKSTGQIGGAGMAMAGIIMCAISIAIFVLGIFACTALFATFANVARSSQ